MHHHRNGGGEPAPRRANTPPPAGNVYGLGHVDALRIELEPAQLPWMAAEIDTLRYCLEDELAHRRARYAEPPGAAKGQHWTGTRDAEQELERREYQLQALAMIREQLPISGEEAAAAVGSPGREPAEGAAPRTHRVEVAPVAFVGPAAIMTVLISGATRNVADTLSEALRGPAFDVDRHTESCRGWRPADLPRVNPAIAEKLRALAAAVHAFTDTYLHVLAHQAYSFDPEYNPVHADELDVSAGQLGAVPGAAGGLGGPAGNS
jgi:hypothetical protein